eukprot:3937208-Rhodomonas_salina.2
MRRTKTYGATTRAAESSGPCPLRTAEVPTISAMLLRSCYAMSGTDVPCRPYEMSATGAGKERIRPGWC